VVKSSDTFKSITAYTTTLPLSLTCISVFSGVFTTERLFFAVETPSGDLNNSWTIKLNLNRHRLGSGFNTQVGLLVGLCD